MPISTAHPHAERRTPSGRRRGRAPPSCSAGPTAHSAQLLTADVDARDKPVPDWQAHARGLLTASSPDMGVEYAIARSLAYAPYADLLWWETSEPNLEPKRERFADAIHKPSSLARCWLTTARRASTGSQEAGRRRQDRRPSSSAIGAMGYKFQFVTLAGFHSLNHSMFTAGPRLSASAAWRRIPSCNKPSLPRKVRGLHGDQAPARSRHRLVRCGCNDRRRWRLVHHSDGRQHRDRAVPRQGSR